MTEKAKTQTVEEKLAALEARVASSDARNDRVTEMALRLASAQQPNAAPAVAAPVVDDFGVNFDDLPDPVTHRADFNKALAKRVADTTRKAAAGATQHINDARVSEQARVDNVGRLWSQFNEKHPDLASATEIVKGQAEEVLGDAARRGLDPERYLFADPDTFMNTVADRTRKRMEKLGVKFETPEEKQAKADEAANAANTNRTGGIVQGLDFPNMGSGPAGAAQQAPKGPEFLEELKDVQRQMKI